MDFTIFLNETFSVLPLRLTHFWNRYLEHKLVHLHLNITLICTDDVREQSMKTKPLKIVSLFESSNAKNDTARKYVDFGTHVVLIICQKFKTSNYLDERKMSQTCIINFTWHFQVHLYQPFFPDVAEVLSPVMPFTMIQLSQIFLWCYSHWNQLSLNTSIELASSKTLAKSVQQFRKWWCLQRINQLLDPSVFVPNVKCDWTSSLYTHYIFKGGSGNKVGVYLCGVFCVMHTNFTVWQFSQFSHHVMRKETYVLQSRGRGLYFSRRGQMSHFLFDNWEKLVTFSAPA